MVGRLGSNRRPSPRKIGTYGSNTSLKPVDIDMIVKEFAVFLKVDLNRTDRTVYERSFTLRRFLESVGIHPTLITPENIRGFLR